MEPPIAFELVAINDIVSIETCPYFLKLGSIYWPAPTTIVQTKRVLILNGYSVRFTHQHLASVNLSDVELVFKCTGKANDSNFATAWLRSGAKPVLILGPPKHADVTVLLGANDRVLQAQRIISNASCTTNVLAPFLCFLDGNFGVLAGHITTDGVSQPKCPMSHKKCCDEYV